MMSWTPQQQRKNALDIMRGNIERDPIGRRLTEQAKQKAAEFAADSWKGRSMGSGDAARIGIHHVTKDILADA